MRKIYVYQAFSDFFNSYEKWQNSQVWKLVFPEPIVFNREIKLEYDYLFRGTHADIEIPLWASASKAHGKILLDQTTLAVIKQYHSYGYRPIWQEGNPPDYIGEQFRFLVYLESARISEAADPRIVALDEFLQSFYNTFLSSLLKLVIQGIRDYATQSCYLLIATQLERLLQVELSADGEIRAPENTLFYLCEFDQIRKNGLQPAIRTPEPETVMTAGINNCGGMCVIAPMVQAGCMLQIQTDQLGNPPLKACVRGRGYRKTFLSSQRLRYPMKRVGKRGAGTFERISWTEAVSLLTTEWQRIKERYGVASRYVMYATGVTGIMRPTDLVKRLLSLDGGYLGYYNSYSSACSRFITPYIYGTACSGNSMADILNTNLLILWGHNPVETHFGSERLHYLNELKKKGVKIIVIDPRFSDSAAALADQWVALRPSTDSALADAMAYVIWSENLHDQAFMDNCCIGFDEAHMPAGVPAGESYHSYLFGERDGVIKTPEWAAAITGVPAQTIITLAREYATAKPACLMVGLGLQRTRNGEQTIRSTALLTCLTGNVGQSGGSAGGVGDVKEHVKLQLADRIDNPYLGKIPVFQWTKAMVSGTSFNEMEDGLIGVEKLEQNIKMIFNLAGNTLINQHSDINDTIALLSQEELCEFIVCSDIFMTPSARYADLLLPATSVFEGDNMANPWAGANYFLYHNQVIKPLFECRFEWDWLKEAAGALGLYEAFTAGKADVEDWLIESYQNLRSRECGLPEYSQMKCRGGWQYPQQEHFIAFAQEVKNPQKNPFLTPSGKIEIFSMRLYQRGQLPEMPAIPCYTACAEGPQDPLREKYPLQLIGWHTKRRCHSTHDNNEWMDEVEMPAVWLHPEDAAVRKIGPGEVVEIFNDRGRIRIPAKVTNRIMKGVVAISQGGWHRPDQQGIDVRGSINVLTTTKNPSPLAKGNPQHTNLVEILKV